ncbi:MAG: hypothetical protein FWC58_06590 [Desulfobulbus sp.]|nr:hypothetical protein [Desulfobulbus sp.]
MARKNLIPDLILVLPQSRPRNPLLVPGLTRKAGVHGNTRKAARQQARQRTQQALTALLAGEVAEFEID